MVRIFSRLSGQVNIDFYLPIQIFGRNGPVGYCLFSPLHSRLSFKYKYPDKEFSRNKGVKNCNGFLTRVSFCQTHSNTHVATQEINAMVTNP